MSKALYIAAIQSILSKEKMKNALFYKLSYISFSCPHLT